MLGDSFWGAYQKDSLLERDSFGNSHLVLGEFCGLGFRDLGLDSALNVRRDSKARKM